LYINKKLKNIAVELSGGAESSLLYYLVCKNYQDSNIYPITLVTEKKPLYADVAKRIIDKVEELTNKSPAKHIVVHGSQSNYVDALDKGVDDTVEKYNIDIIYTGMTINAPAEDVIKWVESKEIQTKYNIELQRAKKHINGRDKSRDNPPSHDTITTLAPKHKILHCSPWNDQNKKAIIGMYCREEIHQTLFPLTISCADDKIFDTVEEYIHCGDQCFPCIERTWAMDTFKKDYTDEQMV
jgi:hypothetical protein